MSILMERLRAGAMLLAVAAASVTWAGPTYRIQPVTASGDAVNFEPIGISNTGVAAGFAIYPDNANSGAPNIQATRWSAGQTERLFQGRDVSQALAINALSEIVGYSSGWNDGPFQGFVNSKGSTQWLPPLIDGPSLAKAISDDGKVVGTSVVDDHKHLVRWFGSEIHDLGTLPDGDADVTGVNNKGQIVGYATQLDANDRFTRNPFIYKDGQLNPLGSLTGTATAIANDGTVVGTTDQDSPRAFSWKDGVIELLALLEDVTESAANAVNSSGLIVGHIGNAADSRAALWSDHQVRDLNALIPHDSGWFLHNAIDINDRGQILGFGYQSDEPTYFLLTPTPPPTAVPLPPVVWSMIGMIPVVGIAMRSLRKVDA